MSSPNLAFPLSFVSFPDLGVEMPELEGDDPKALAQALRQWQDENWKEDLSLSMAPGLGTPYAAADLAASRELDEPAWMQAIYAAGLIPGFSAATKAGRKLLDLLADLPAGGMQKFIDEFASKSDANVEKALKYFDDEGNLVSWHGSSDTIPEFSTEALLNNMGRNDINVGPGTYTSSDAALPLMMAGAEGSQNLHRVVTPREDLGQYMVMDFPGRMTNDYSFADQTEAVKDALSELYPHATDEDKYQLFRRSMMGGDVPKKMDRLDLDGEPMSAELQSHIANIIRGGDRLESFQDANEALRDVGILGNVHTEIGRPQYTHFDPDSLVSDDITIALPMQWHKARMEVPGRLDGDPELTIQALDDLYGLIRPPGEVIRRGTEEAWDLTKLKELLGD